MTPVRVGFDIGATKCAVLVEGPTDTHSRTAPSHGWNAEPVEHGAAWILSTLESVLPPGARVDALAVGAQGIDRAEVGDRKSVV